MRFRGLGLIAGGAGIVLAGIVGFVFYLVNSPSTAVLAPKDGVDWLRVPAAFNTGPKYSEVRHAFFRNQLQLPVNWRGGELKLSAMRRGQVYLDGRLIFDTGADLTRWRQVYQVPLPAALSAGNHNLGIDVSNIMGPPMVRVSCPQLQIDSWQGSNDGLTWTGVIEADKPFEPVLQNHFVTARDGFEQYGVLFTGIAALGTLVSYRWPGRVSIGWVRFARWLMLGAWVVISIQANIALTGPVGYDIRSHLQYIWYVGQMHHLPRADEGWEYFQAPLFYIISGLEFGILRHLGFSPEDTVAWLRVIPLLCGMAMLEVVYRTARVVFPDRGDLQLVATVVGGFMPMNLYMAQTVSNEPVAACIAAAAMLFCMQIIKQPERSVNRRLIILGIVLGVAFLTKVTAIFWVVPIELCVIIAAFRSNTGWKRTIRQLAIVPAIALILSGAYLIRNKVTVGHWLVTQTVGQWWQDPGYRTPGALVRFGHVLYGPVFTMNRSVWDSLYGTMWGDQMLSGAGIVDHLESPGENQTAANRLNYIYTVHKGLPYDFEMMACGQWLALLPMAMILIGMIAGLVVITTRVKCAIDPVPLLISSLMLWMFTAAIVFEYMTVPMYGWAKSSYMLSTIPCLAILAATGFDLLGRNRILRATMSGILFSWAVCAYFTFWVK